MSHDNNILDISMSRKKKNRLPDREKIVLAYHAFEHDDPKEGQNLLASVDQGYYVVQFHKDISRALLCWSTFKSIQDATQSENMRKESEFYLIVYRLTKIIVGNRLNFPKSGNFTELTSTLFRDFAL